MDTDGTPDCLQCSYMGARKYKLCDECFAHVVAETEAQIESTRESERLTADDFNVRINCVAD